MQDEQIYTLALTRIPGLGLMGACSLMRTLGSASAIFQNRKDLKELIPEVSHKLVKALDCPEAFKRAKQELQFAEKNQIQCITLNDPPILPDSGSVKMHHWLCFIEEMPLSMLCESLVW